MPGPPEPNKARTGILLVLAGLGLVVAAFVDGIWEDPIVPGTGGALRVASAAMGVGFVVVGVLLARSDDGPM